MTGDIYCIREIENFDKYLSTLKAYKKRILLVFAVKDTPGLNFREESVKLMQEFGICTNLHNKHWHSYIAIMLKGDVLLDQLSETDDTMTSVMEIEDDINLSVKSSVFKKENVAKIMINGKDYATNVRGLNIVVYDLRSREVIDSVCFDTHLKSNKCTRKTNPQNLIASQIMEEIHNLKINNEILMKQNEELKKTFQTSLFKAEMLMWYSIKSVGESEHEARCRFFRSMSKAKGTLRKVQVIGTSLLRHFDAICRKNNITYWISFGTLLGAVRHKGFIPWDDDVDVCMTRDDLNNLLKIIKGNESFCIKRSITISDQNFNLCYKFRFKNTKDIPFFFRYFCI